MNRNFVMTALMLVTIAANGQEALPSGLRPLEGELILRHIPNVESSCTVRMQSKRSGNVSGSKSTIAFATATFDDPPGLTNFAVFVSKDNNYFRLILAKGAGYLNAALEGRTNLFNSYGVISGGSSDPVFQTSNSALGPWETVPDNQALIEGASPHLLAFKILEPFVGLRAVDMTLRQGAPLRYNACGVTGGIRKQKDPGEFSFVGTALVSGREAIIFSGSQRFTCEAFAGGSVTLKGWSAVDRQTGMPLAQSTIEDFALGNGDTNSTNADYDCKISGAPLSGQQSAPISSAQKPAATDVREAKSIERRLTQLKALFDKGLISKDQYEKKNAEIIQNL